MSKTISGNGAAYLAVGAGVILLWSGVKGKSVSAVARSILTGKDPGRLPDANQFDVVPGSGSVAGTGPLPATDSAIANDAMQYVGTPYVWAGHLPTGWDCSGYVWYVLGHDFGMTILGMRYSARWHGPVAAAYLGVGTGVPHGQEQPGDLIVFATHIGFVVGGGHMVSALSPQYGTKVTPYDWGPKGEPYSFRRVAVPVMGKPRTGVKPRG